MRVQLRVRAPIHFSCASSSASGSLAYGARGRDIYAITAPIIVEAMERVLDGRATATGALAPGQLFDPEDFLRALSPGHLTFTVER